MPEPAPDKPTQPRTRSSRLAPLLDDGRITFIVEHSTEAPPPAIAHTPPSPGTRINTGLRLPSSPE